MRAAYFVLPVLVVALIVRMISAETLDFSLVLLVCRWSPASSGPSTISSCASVARA